MDPLIIGTIVVIILGGVGKFVQVMLKEFREQRGEFTSFLNNHMSSWTKAQQDVAVTLALLADSQTETREALKTGFAQMHADSLRTARRRKEESSASN